MPTYEYACPSCGHHFETFQSMKDEPLKECPKCHQKTLKRLLGTGAGLIFKGSGFYITDYKNKGGGSGSGEAKSGGESKSSDSGSSAKSSESKSTGGGGDTKSSASPKSP